MNTQDYILKKYNVSFDEATPMPIEIPNVGRFDLLRWLRELDFRMGAEIGVAEGEYTKMICQTNPQMKIYAVDPWAPYQGYSDYVKQDALTTLFEEAQRRLEPFIKRGICEIVKEFSMDALEKFGDESLDFVYIDANHSDPYITHDITQWSKKVKPGGIISGHDYIRPRNANYNVIEAVNTYTNNHHIRPWFVLGSQAKILRMIRDEFRSWMWVKNK